ncbi:hypothetical protein ACWNT8_01525 [Pigmentibacter ruber]|nr:hypothetical protein GTC16762_06040 [Pigmentibacter ruber]
MFIGKQNNLLLNIFLNILGLSFSCHATAESFPLPGMNKEEIEKYVAQHSNSMPDLWGRSFVTSQSYKDLHLENIGTQLTCKKFDGCSGYIYFYRNNRNNLRNHNEFSFMVHDNKSNSDKGFTIVEESNTLVTQLYYKYTDGKFYREAFNPISPSINGGIALDGSYSDWQYYKANYGEAFLYIPVLAAPQEVAGFYLGFNNPELSKHDFPTQIMSNDGSQERLNYYTIWRLKGQYLVPANSESNLTFQVTQGVTTTDSTSFAYQLNIPPNAFTDMLLSAGLSYTSTHSVAVQDSSTVTESIKFPPVNYNSIDAVYSLALASKTLSPNLEKFMENGNKQLIQENAFFNWELAKSGVINEYDNVVDAKSPDSNYINSYISVKSFFQIPSIRQ